MSLSDPCLIRARGPSGKPVVRLGMPLVDDYLEFLDRRCRPNTVLAAEVDHASGAPALALQAHLGEARFGYSGDTAWTDTLPAAAQGSDVFACEAYTYQKPVRYHLDLADLRAHAHEMATGRLILTHLGPSMLARLDDIEYETAADGLTLHT